MCGISRFLLLACYLFLMCPSAAKSEQPSAAPAKEFGARQTAEESAPSKSGRQKSNIAEPDEHHLPQGHSAVAPLFKDLFFRYTGRGYHNRLIRYRLFVPDDLTPPKKYPMIVWLHGRGDGGKENAKQLNHLDECIFTEPSAPGQFQFFFLAVECPPGNPLWTTSSAEADDMINVVVAAMDKTIGEYPVDASAISLAGISSGGSGVWDLAMRFPERFSAIAPMASSGGDLARKVFGRASHLGVSLGANEELPSTLIAKWSPQSKPPAAAFA